MDDAMTANRERALEIWEGLKNNGLGVTWTMMTRVDFVDEEMLTAAKQAGCTQIEFGIESGHPETLKRIRKPHTVAMVRQIIPMTAALGIKPVAFFILGFPWDTPESLDETQRLMQELSPHVDAFHPAVASILVPFPSTHIYEQYKDEYSFVSWWLRDERCYDVPDPRRHPYFETQLFPVGAVLDADFFRYSAAVRRKIHEIFTFMWYHNLARQPLSVRVRRSAMFEVSRRLHALSPAVEHGVFTQISRIKHAAAGAIRHSARRYRGDAPA